MKAYLSIISAALFFVSFQLAYQGATAHSRVYTEIKQNSAGKYFRAYEHRPMACVYYAFSAVAGFFAIGTTKRALA